MQLFTFRKEIKIKDTFSWTTTKSIQLGDDLTGTELQKKVEKISNYNKCKFYFI